jgi:precorrin-2 dehydrogenase/sirohydrochlorin ferrochelatase
VSYYPVFLELEGQRCVVIGLTEAAATKARQLEEAGASVLRIAPEDYHTGQLAGARLAIDASGDPEVTRRARREASQTGVLLNVMDQPEQCDFIAPAIAKRGPLQIAVSTSGESPFLAAALRDRIQEELGQDWGQFVALVGELRRELRRRGVPAGEQRAAYESLLHSKIPQLLKQGAVAAARRQAKALARRAISEGQPVEAG